MAQIRLAVSDVFFLANGFLAVHQYVKPNHLARFMQLIGQFPSIYHVIKVSVLVMSIVFSNLLYLLMERANLFPICI